MKYTTSKLIVFAESILIMCFMLRTVSAEMTIDAPTSLTMYSERGDLRVAASAKRVYVANTDYVFREIDLPEGILDATGDVVIGVIATSADERSIFMGTQGGDGLYRYDINARKWDAIRPPSAPAAISAIAVEADGGLLVGSGGYFTNTSLDAAGVFRSNDNGDTWVQVVLRYDGNETAPGIRDLAVSNTGNLLISSRGFNGTIPSGVYELGTDDTLRRVFANTAESVHWVGNRGYFLQSGLVSSYTRTDGKFLLTHIWDATTKCKSITSWHDDSLLIHVRPSDDDNRALIILDTTIVRSIDLEFIGKSRLTPTLHASVGLNGRSILSFGCGRNLAVNVWNGASEIIRCIPERPQVTTLVSALSWSLMYAETHGWFRIGSDGVARHDEQLSSTLTSIPGVNHSTRDNEILFTNSRVVRTVTDSGVDTLFNAAGVYSLYDAALSESGSRLYVAHSNGFTEVALSDQMILELSIDGWPTYVNALTGDTVLLICQALFVVHDKLFGWASGSYQPIDTFESGGLYEYRGGQWAKVSGMVQGRRSAYARAKSSKNQIVVSAVEYGGGGQVSLPSITVLQVDRMLSSIRSSSENVIPFVQCVATFKNDVLWCTTYGRLWLSSAQSAPVLATTLTRVECISEMDSNIIASTYDRGVIIFRMDDVQTEVADPEHHIVHDVPLYPNPVMPGQDLFIDNIECPQKRMHNYEIVDVSGRVQQLEILGTDESRCQVASPQVSALPPGSYLLRITGRQCNHASRFVVAK